MGLEREPASVAVEELLHGQVVDNLRLEDLAPMIGKKLGNVNRVDRKSALRTKDGGEVEGRGAGGPHDNPLLEPVLKRKRSTRRICGAVEGV